MDQSIVTKEYLQNLSKQWSDDTIRLRRQLHAAPELSFQEKQTASFIQACLTQWGIAWQSMATTGVVAHIQGEGNGNICVALRADMDALPILEDSGQPYVSQHPGVMHACGHDAHTASLLTTARILQHCRSQFGGTIKLIFQPGEEVLPGGASLLINEGALEAPKPDCVLALHVQPQLQAGRIALRGGAHMASMDELRFIIRGKGGHAAQPHTLIDPVYTAAQLIIALQQVVSRKANPASPTVLSIGRIVADGAINIIPHEVTLEGTLRCFDEDWRRQAHEWIRQTAAAIATASGATCETIIRLGYPVLNNDVALAGKVKSLANEFLGKEQVEEAPVWMAAEDFASYAQEVPGCFYLLGVRNETKGITAGLHTPQFDLDEDVLHFSPGLMAWLALGLLK